MSSVLLLYLSDLICEQRLQLIHQQIEEVKRACALAHELILLEHQLPYNVLPEYC